MNVVKVLEKKFAKLFKALPKIPDATKQTLVHSWPYLAITASILQLFLAWKLYAGTRQVAVPVADYINQLYTASGAHNKAPVGAAKIVAYIGIMLLVTAAVLMFLAYPKLQKKSKKGWDLLFISFAANTLYAILSLFLYNGGVLTLMVFLAGSIVGFYLLYQVREKYRGGARVFSLNKE